MADEYYPIPAEPQYREQIRKLQNSDPASADGTFNPLIAALIENTAAVKKQADAAQQTLVEATVPSRTVTVAAEDLQAYVAALPRLLTEDLTIQIPDGIADKRIDFTYFYGPGSLTIEAAGSNLVIDSAQIMGCKVPVTFNNISFNSPISGFIVQISNSMSVMITRCKIGPDSKNSSKNQGGIILKELSNVYVNNCLFKNTHYGISAWEGSISRIASCVGENITYGFGVNGGVHLLFKDTSNTLNAAANVNIAYGGCIIGSDGTVIAIT